MSPGIGPEVVHRINPGKTKEEEEDDGIRARNAHFWPDEETQFMLSPLSVQPGWYVKFNWMKVQ